MIESIASQICLLIEETDLSNLESELQKLKKELQSLSSRFVDIDPSVKHDHDKLDSVHAKLHHEFGKEKADEIYHLYETLQSYLYMRHKHGEAADWFLKSELI